MKPDFSDLHVVVTGGSGALGAAVVRQLLEAGAHCHVPVFAPQELRHFEDAGHERVHVSEGVDLSSEAETVAYFAALPSLWASIHCAGGFAMADIADLDLTSHQRLMDLNATTCLLCCREAVDRIRTTPSGPAGGRLVNVAARPALEPRIGAHMVSYTMSKAAVAALTESLAEELARERIWVNAVAPSIMDTPANRAAMPDADPEAWPTVLEVAATMVFLASPQNASTRGAVVPVYGPA